MAIRSQEEARDDILVPLQLAVSCISKAVVIEGRGEPFALPSLTFSERFVPLQGEHRLDLSLLHLHQFEERLNEPGYWGVKSVGYAYQLRERSGAELIRFEWHPFGHQIPFPHLHIHGQAGSIRIDAKKHVPTGRVSVESVVRFAITELGVRALRRDWRQVLERGEQEFNARRAS